MSARIAEIRVHPISVGLERASWMSLEPCRAAAEIVVEVAAAPQVHGHLLGVVPNGLIQEVFPNAVRDPVWDGLFAERPAIEGGTMHLPERPGLGIVLDREALARWSTREVRA